MLKEKLPMDFAEPPENFKIARAALHFWEEPCISPEKKRKRSQSFFSSCNLKCVYCQNYEISRDNKGIEISCVTGLLTFLKILYLWVQKILILLIQPHFASMLAEVL